MHLKKYDYMIMITKTDDPMLLKQKKIFNKFIGEKCVRIIELSEIINDGCSTCHFRNKSIAENKCK